MVVLLMVVLLMVVLLMKMICRKAGIPVLGPIGGESHHDWVEADIKRFKALLFIIIITISVDMQAGRHPGLYERLEGGRWQE